PTPLRKGVGQQALGRFITASDTWKYSDWRDPFCEVVLSTALDPEHSTSARHPFRRPATEVLVRCQRQDQPAPIGKAIEPALDGLRAARIDIDDIGLVERDRSAISGFSPVRARARAPERSELVPPNWGGADT